MGGEDVEAVRRGFQVFARRGLDGMLDHIHEDIEWVQDADFPGAQTFRGHAGVRRWYERLSDSFEEISVEPEEIIQAADRVVVLLRLETRGRGSGIVTTSRLANVWTVRDGKGARVEFHLDPGRALEATGAQPLHPERWRP